MTVLEYLKVVCGEVSYQFAIFRNYNIKLDQVRRDANDILLVIASRVLLLCLFRDWLLRGRSRLRSRLLPD